MFKSNVHPAAVIGKDKIEHVQTGIE